MITRKQELDMSPTTEEEIVKTFISAIEQNIQAAKQLGRNVIMMDMTQESDYNTKFYIESGFNSLCTHFYYDNLSCALCDYIDKVAKHFMENTEYKVKVYNKGGIKTGTISW